MSRHIFSYLRKNIKMFNCLKTYRKIHCNPQLRYKMYMEQENMHAYTIMEKMGYVSKIILPKKDGTSLTHEEFSDMLSQDWSKQTPKTIFEAFPVLGKYSSQHNISISNPLYDVFIDNLTDNIKNASDLELLTIFNDLLDWPETCSIRTRNYIEVWAALDDECLNRSPIWTYDENLNFVRLFYMLNVTKNSEFSSKCVQKLASKVKNLTTYQFVQTLFYIGIIRKAPYDMHNLELYFDNNFEKFTTEEIAVISMGFFKSKTPLRNQDLVEKVIYKVIEDSQNIHEVSLAAILKIIRYSYKKRTNNLLYELLDRLQHEISRISNMCKVHVALVGMANLTLHRECMDKIAESTIPSISMTRIKDLERFSLSYGTFNHKPVLKECFFQKVVEQLKSSERVGEIENYGRSFACCVAYLSILGIYPVDLMSKVLSPEFLKQTYGKQVLSYGREILSIHNMARIFCPEAEMNRLTDKAATILAKKYTDYVPDERINKQFNVSEKMMLDILRNLREMRGGDEYVIADHVLTHHQRGDILICNDNHGSPVNVKQTFNSDNFGLIRPRPDDNTWIVLVVGGRNSQIYNTDMVTGQFLCKLRELTALGYKAVLISWSTYDKLETDDAKKNYLNSLIKEAL